MSRTDVEIEIKLRVQDIETAHGQLRLLQAKPLGRVHERNTLFDTPEYRLKNSGGLLRVRFLEPAEPQDPTNLNAPRPSPGRPSGLLTYKGIVAGPGGASRYKAREEIEVAIDKPEAAERILVSVGFRPWFRYEKYRTSFRLPGLPILAVELDETPLGVFFELEGPEDSIDQAARQLDYKPKDYLTSSYYELFLQERHRLGFPPDAMLFPAST